MVRCGRVAAFYFAKTRGSEKRRVSCNGYKHNEPTRFCRRSRIRGFTEHILWQLTWRRWPPKCSLRRPIPADPMGAPIAAVSAQTSRRFLWIPTRLGQGKGFSPATIATKKDDCQSNRLIWRRHPDSNRGVKVLQTSALPLGYGATGRATYRIIAGNFASVKQFFRIFHGSMHG